MAEEYWYQTIKNPKGKISETLAELELEIVDKDFTVDRAIKNEKRFFMPLCRDKEGNKVFFKARLQNSEEVLDTLKKEIVFFRDVGPTISIKKPHFIIAKFRKEGNDGQEFHWMTREYFDGEFSGYMDVNFGIENKFLDSTDPKDIALRLLNIQAVSREIIKIIKPQEHGFSWFQADYTYYQNTVTLQKLIPQELNQIPKIFEKNQELLDKSTQVISHGDLYPNNILLLTNKDVSLIDWELININSAAFDPGFIFMLSFRNKTWQKEFLNTILDKTSNQALFKELFPLVVLSLSLRFLRANQIAISTFQKGYQEKMVDYGYSPEQIKEVPEKAQEAQGYHLEIFKKTLKNPQDLLKTYV